MSNPIRSRALRFWIQLLVVFLIVAALIHSSAPSVKRTQIVEPLFQEPELGSSNLRETGQTKELGVLGDQGRASNDNATTDWTRFAYCTYATDTNYLCNSVMILGSLHKTGAKADKLLLYNDEWTVSPKTYAGRLLMHARDEFKAVLQPVKLVHHGEGDDETWSDSFTKLLAWNQTRYKRVLSLDSDATVRKPMDDLFLVPSAPVAAPNAYWLDQETLSSQVILVEPSSAEFARIEEEFKMLRQSEFDMEILNKLYKATAMRLPHRPNNLITGEFKSTLHWAYLSSVHEKWDPKAELERAAYVHFSDWPLPKPWLMEVEDELGLFLPKCQQTDDGIENCDDRSAWISIYQDYWDRKKRICDVEIAT